MTKSWPTSRDWCTRHAPEAVHVVVHPAAEDLANIGDASMLLVALQRIRRQWPDACVVSTSSDAEQLRRWDPEIHVLDPRAMKARWFELMLVTSGRSVSPAARGAINAVGHLRRRAPVAMHRAAAAAGRMQGVGRGEVAGYGTPLTSADLVLLSGGGYLTDSFKRSALRALSALDEAGRHGATMAATGQGLGPVADPYLRERMQTTLGALGGLLLREGVRSPELVPGALFLVTGDDAVVFAYTRRPVVLGESLGVNVRMGIYAAVADASARNAATEIRQTASDLGVSLTAVPVSRHPSEDDVVTARALFGTGITDSAEDIETPEALAAAVARCRTVVTGSYHAAVFALSMGIPTVALVAGDYYAPKFAGLAAQFGVGCHAVDLRTATPGSVSRAISRAWARADDTRGVLVEAAAEQVRLGDLGYARVFDATMRSLRLARRWAGAGSNRRPSAFQADARTN